ncbi:MAG TPA: serine protease, partial [Micromonosporaceae bacterium]|nr:serine protease [Micromonosporaceae bacterium]
MRQGTTRLRWVALSAAAFALALGFLPGTSAAAQPNNQPATPTSERASESEQFRAEGVTTVGELRTVDSSVSYLPDGRRQVIQHPGATYIKVHFSSLRLGPG